MYLHRSFIVFLQTLTSQIKNSKPGPSGFKLILQGPGCDLEAIKVKLCSCLSNQIVPFADPFGLIALLSLAAQTLKGSCCFSTWFFNLLLLHKILQLRCRPRPWMFSLLFDGYTRKWTKALVLLPTRDYNRQPSYRSPLSFNIDFQIKGKMWRLAGGTIAEDWHKLWAKPRRRINPAKVHSRAALFPHEHLRNSWRLLKDMIMKDTGRSLRWSRAARKEVEQEEE